MRMNQTVRDIAAKLNIPKPAISRGVDRQEATNLARRKADPLDRRSILVARTTAGNQFRRELQAIMTAAGRKSITANGKPRHRSSQS